MALDSEDKLNKRKKIKYLALNDFDFAFHLEILILMIDVKKPLYLLITSVPERGTWAIYIPTKKFR